MLQPSPHPLPARGSLTINGSLSEIHLGSTLNFSNSYSLSTLKRYHYFSLLDVSNTSSQFDLDNNITDHLFDSFTYPSICFRPSASAPCFLSSSSSPRSLSLAFIPGARDEALSRQSTWPKFTVENPQSEPIRQMKSGVWVAYAARALVIRYWELAKVSTFTPWLGLVTYLAARKHQLLTSSSSLWLTSACTLPLSVSSSAPAP